MADKLQQAGWQPDYGPAQPHKTAGCAVIGARPPLIAFNVNLNTTNVEIAQNIARRIRHSNGGLRFCKAMGVSLGVHNLAQVSMNLTNYRQTSIYQAVELIKIEATRYGVTVAGSELIGMLPLEAVTDCAAYYLGLDDFGPNRILEANFD